MHARQAAKAKAAKEPFRGFKGPVERILLLELMRPKIHWRLRRQIDAHFALTEKTGEIGAMISANEASMKSLGVAPLVSPEAVEGFAPLPQEVPPKFHSKAREMARRRRQSSRIAANAV
jgi:hypothetical protein